MPTTIIAVLLLCAIGPVLVYGTPLKLSQCTTHDGPILYLDRWERRDGYGLCLPEGTTTFAPDVNPMYGHIIKVPYGYEVVVEKEPFMGERRIYTYYAKRNYFVTYDIWDTPITTITVHKKI